MGRTGAIWTAGALGALAGLAGCVSDRTITVAYADQLGRLHEGMSIAEFEAAVPRAREFQHMWTGGREFVVYELKHRYKPDELPAKDEVLYFFFTDGAMVRWGRSHASP